MRPRFAPPLRRTGVFRSGSRRACSTRSGGRGCSSTTAWSGSTGSGWPPTGRWARHRWAGRRPDPIRLKGKKGAKRSLLCEAGGVPIGVAHDGANRHDSMLLEPTLASVPIERPVSSVERPQGLCLDRGYDYPWVHELSIERGFAPHVRSRGEEIKLKLRTPGWRARRWVVEACHSWLNRNRALLIRWSKKEQNHLALLQLACGLIAFKKARLALPG
ncbi:MAG: transposase [Gaiellaceae bacterium]